MFESIFGLYSVLIASTRTLYGHGRGVVPTFKIASIFVPILVPILMKGFLRGVSTDGSFISAIDFARHQPWPAANAALATVPKQVKLIHLIELGNDNYVRQ